MWIHSLLIPSNTFEQFKATREGTHQSYIARQRVTTRRLRRAHLPRWKLPRNALDHSFWTDSGWQRRPEFIDRCREKDYDVTQPGIAVYKHNWKVHRNTVYWSNLRVAQSKGLQFHQARSNAIILHNSLPAKCIDKVVVMKSGEELYSKTFQSSIPPQRVGLKTELEL